MKIAIYIVYIATADDIPLLQNEPVKIALWKARGVQ